MSYENIVFELMKLGGLIMFGSIAFVLLKTKISLGKFGILSVSLFSALMISVVATRFSDDSTTVNRKNVYGEESSENENREALKSGITDLTLLIGTMYALLIFLGIRKNKVVGT